eukprot:904959-Rhodomonas_salina.6
MVTVALLRVSSMLNQQPNHFRVSWPIPAGSEMQRCVAIVRSSINLGPARSQSRYNLYKALL